MPEDFTRSCGSEALRKSVFKCSGQQCCELLLIVAAKEISMDAEVVAVLWTG